MESASERIARIYEIIGKTAPERMARYTAVAAKLVDDPAVAEELGFNIMELEDSCHGVLLQIRDFEEIGGSTVDVREAIIWFIGELLHFRGHARNVRRILDRVICEIDSMTPPLDDEPAVE